MKWQGWIGENVNVSTLKCFSTAVTVISYSIIWPSEHSFSLSSLKNQLCVQWTNSNKQDDWIDVRQAVISLPRSFCLYSVPPPPIIISLPFFYSVVLLSTWLQKKILLKSAFSHPEHFLYSSSPPHDSNTDIRLSGGDVTSSSDTHLILLWRQKFI